MKKMKQIKNIHLYIAVMLLIPISTYAILNSTAREVANDKAKAHTDGLTLPESKNDNSSKEDKDSNGSGVVPSLSSVGWTLNHDFTEYYNVVYDLEEYNGKLYAAMGNGYNDDEVYEYDGASWVLNSNISSKHPLMQYYVKSLEKHNGKLYAGLGGEAGYADIYEYDGNSWNLSKEFGGSARSVEDMIAFNGKLYAVLNGSSKLWVMKGGVWSETHDFGAGRITIEALGVHNKKLYVGLRESGSYAELWESQSGNSWSLVYDFASVQELPSNRIYSLVSYKNNLYIGAGDSNARAAVWQYDGKNISLSSRFGLADAVENMVVYNDNLYAGISGASDEAEVYMFDGSSWVKSFDAGLQYEDILGMEVFNGSLYVGTGTTGGDADVYTYK